MNSVSKFDKGLNCDGPEHLLFPGWTGLLPAKSGPKKWAEVNWQQNHWRTWGANVGPRWDNGWVTVAQIKEDNDGSDRKRPE